MEEWKEIPGYEGLYKVSNFGSIKNKNNIQMKPQLSKQGYYKITLYKNKKKTYFIHRLVLLAFVGQSNLQVNHKNFNKIDNSLVNLEYVTPIENIHHFRNSDKIQSIYHSGLNEKFIARIEYLSWLIKDISSSDTLSIIKTLDDYVNDRL